MSRQVGPSPGQTFVPKKGIFGLCGFDKKGKRPKATALYPTREEAEAAVGGFELANPHAHRSREAATFGSRFVVRDLLANDWTRES